MRILISGFLFLVAAALVGAILVGVAIKVAVFFLAIAALAAGVLFVIGKIYGPPHMPDDEMDHAKR
ncbi:MAG: hypothetical protein GC155_08535 [Alphaproteobacteria bacterium]|nr:hypothetical protein [Alphaproteobacteria bacterium]